MRVIHNSYKIKRQDVVEKNLTHLNKITQCKILF